MASYLNNIGQTIAPVIRGMISTFTSTTTFTGRLVWIMIGMIIFDYVLKLTFRLMGRNVH